MIDFRLHLIRCGERFVVGADTTTLAQADHLELGEQALRQLVRIGQSFAAGHLLDVDEARRFGNVIFRSVVRRDIRDCYLAARASAAERGTAVRLILRLSIGSLLHEVPWELMFDGERFLACHAESPLVRYVPSKDPADQLAVGERLRVLLTSASPAGVPPIDDEAEEDALRQGLAGLDRVDLAVRHGVSRADLIELFQRAHRAGEPIHLWHHAGHGRLSSGDERLLLVLEHSRQPELAEAWSLAQLVRGETGLRMAVLNLCFGAAPLGLASHLARLGLPAVVGFRGRLLETEARAFARYFYANLDSATVDLALARTRQALALDGAGLAWARPLLFTRTEDLALWGETPPPPAHEAETALRPGEIRFHNGRMQTRVLKQVGRAGGRALGDAPVSFDNESIRADEILQVGELRLAEGDEAFERRFRELSRRSRLWGD